MTKNKGLKGNAYPVKEVDQDQITSPSVSRAVQIIEYLSHGPSTLADLSKQLNIPKSTLHGILSTLEAHQWIQINDRQIRQGPGLFQTVIRYSQNEMLKPVFQEVGKRIVLACGETTFLGILDGDRILHVARVDGTAPLRYVAEEGEHGPAHASALGKVLLAEFDLDEVRNLLATPSLPAMTAHSLTGLDELLGYLPAVREEGYALDLGEVTEGLYCVAAPIRDASGKAIASIALAAPEFRFTERQSEYIGLISNAATEISTRLGYTSR